MFTDNSPEAGMKIPVSSKCSYVNFRANLCLLRGGDIPLEKSLHTKAGMVRKERVQ